jgi:hypothetical protein
MMLLVGSADKFRLRPRLLRIYGSNAGLARARAAWVEKQLADCDAFLGGKAPPIVNVTSGNAVVGAEKTWTETAADRSVHVFGVWVEKSPVSGNGGTVPRSGSPAPQSQ